MSEDSYEVNFDGLIGPTHNFAGLAHGNIASMTNIGRISNPKRAALQGLKKMKFLQEQGIRQAVIPPLYRPDFAKLRNLGFDGTEESILKKLSTQPPEMVSGFYSASSMWTANAGTVSPSADSSDGKVHFTPANLVNKLHRSLEWHGTFVILKALFGNSSHFTVHEALHPHAAFGDEGAANHTRLCEDYGKPGIEFFVYGKKAFGKGNVEPTKFPARHTYEASQAIARLHQLDPEKVVYVQQNPAAIDAGAFHNDVVAVGNKNLLFYHEHAFLNEEALRKELSSKFAKISKTPLQLLRVEDSEVPLVEAIKSYLFNSQLLSIANGKMLLFAPVECQENDLVRNYLKSLTENKKSPIERVEFVDLRESMLNGGGPACLRLRTVLTEKELAAAHQGVFLDDALYAKLETWVQKNYRDTLSNTDLCDPVFNAEVKKGLTELTQILGVGSIYPFQNHAAR